MMALLKSVRDRLDAMGDQPAAKPTHERKIFEERNDERSYAKLPICDPKEENRYGRKIDLIDLTENKLPKNRSMYINENPAVGCNPNRNKQHGFHFTADNCIGCHACEAACSEKNDNPAHISFRSVGYVEGGSYPAYQRMNISMACNHCDDPVCLKGCPTRAYTKHVEYGAVLQDPETCFGCGYCTWVCPYNAPQLDPIQGRVSKCNMCVDRLEEGLKPACVSACLGNALNFGVIEEMPENRDQIEAQIPGFPDPSITNPNIRFQQTRSMPNEMTRTDSMPIKYHKEDDGNFVSVVDEKEGKEQFFNLKRLSSRENPLVIFTLATQAVIGAFMTMFLSSLFGIEVLAPLSEGLTPIFALIVMIAIQAGVLVLSTLHLGKPLRFYRGFNNLKHSPLSREALGIAMFFAGLCGYTFLTAVNMMLESGFVSLLATLSGLFACVSGIVGLYFMHCIYRVKARPFWNHWQVLTSFYGTMFSLGSVFLGVFFLAGSDSTLLSILAIMTAIGLTAEGLGLVAHARYLNTESGEGAAAHYIQSTTFGKTYLARNAMMITAVVLSIAALATGGLTATLFWSLAAVLTTAALLIGRALFYVLVIPTTMPGAFFWKNKGFEQHAKDIGLAAKVEAGVVADAH
ncbi:DmsC/YnfH family molybdoenzyme membrane anchor subunit [Neptuniibacter sp.]|uniref:DmsC/YnfH family molybdoenzyme membrane anchor subunit n=1 Tax=Neptuniibacter sp. TaxID=1962643 RepID=UPI002615C60B|nr:DmsC/YnfH family molybdoenzyme membrane anchor subunit [Neptuniibacter sp.]MCP4597117.1 dimethyl sulfoxide reductase anchor subunit [Neptuniibacter sp.]